MKSLSIKLLSLLTAVWLSTFSMGAQAEECVCHDVNSVDNGPLTVCHPNQTPNGHASHLTNTDETKPIDTAGVCPGDVDTDGDGVFDDVDNCIDTPNADQADGDGDGVGDACDNCVGDMNADQADADNDGVGDVCEPDTDGDGTIDDDDNCPDDSNPGQDDGDGDGVGDVCDNCPADSNPDQADADNDGTGDVCDAGDTDGDGAPDDTDNCVDVFNEDQADSDTDGVGDACDNCVDVPNPDQADQNQDGTGDACDAGDVFDETGTCGDDPILSSCAKATKAILKVKSFRKMVWKWKGEAGDLSQFSDPAVTDYDLCVYVNGTLVRNTKIPMGSNWKTKLAKDGVTLKKHRYKHKPATPDGVKKTVVKNKAKEGKDMAKGVSLNPPLLSELDTESPEDSIVVQLVDTGGTNACLESTHDEPFNKSNAKVLKDKAVAPEPAPEE